MDSSTRLWIVVTMVAVLAGAHLLEREMAGRREKPEDLSRLRQALLAPLEPGQLPAIPGAEEPPKLETHTVGEGETLGEIAQRFLGSSRAYPLLLELNRDRLKSPRHLRVGMELLVPDPAWLRRRAERKRHEREAEQRGAQATSRSGGANPTGGGGTGRAAAGRVTPAGVYVVKPGDTPGGIAQKVLGSVRHLPLLLEANRGVLDDPRRLKVGTRLRVPTRR
jgi:nucleoid-associated protein YgaU